MSKFNRFLGFFVAAVTPFFYVLIIDFDDIKYITLTFLAVFIGFIFQIILYSDSALSRRQFLFYWLAFLAGYLVGIIVVLVLLSNIRIMY
jgi:hypothetical protein